MPKLIIHLSDIHIGSSPDRYDEYAQIFSKLSAELAAFIKNGHDCTIAITGDTFHNKTRVTSKDIKCFTRLLSSLHNLPTVIILGNHDVNLNANNAEDDLISPILEHSHFKNVILSKTTEVIALNGINFVHASIAEKFDISRVESLLSSVDKPVLLYHGFAVGAILNNSIIRKGDITRELTAKTHLTLLGDIHERCLVADNAGYAGSLIQQNQSEDFKKGFILWNYETREPIFADIKNKFCKIRIDSKDKELTFDQIQQEKQKILDYFGSDVEVSTISIIGNSGETFAQQKEWVKEIFGKTVDRISMTLNKQNKKLMDSTQVLRDLLEKTPNIDENTKFAVIKLHEEFLVDRQICQWSVVSLEWSNMMSYGPNNYINFGALHNITGVIAKNKMGKSSIIDILCYALFGKTIRGLRSDIFRFGQKEFFVKVHFIVNGVEYSIERYETATKNKYCKFQKYESNTWVNLTPQDVNLIYTKYTSALIGTLENFQETSLYFQECDSIIVMPNKRATDRRKRFAKLLGTETNKDIMNVVKQRKKTEQEKLNKMQQAIATIPLEYRSVAALSEFLETTQNNLDEDLENLEENEKEINDLRYESNAAANTIQSADKLIKLNASKTQITTELNSAELTLSEFYKQNPDFTPVYTLKAEQKPLTETESNLYSATIGVDLQPITTITQELNLLRPQVTPVLSTAKGPNPAVTKEYIAEEIQRIQLLTAQTNAIDPIKLREEINELFSQISNISITSVVEPKISKEELEEKRTKITEIINSQQNSPLQSATNQITTEQQIQEAKNQLEETNKNIAETLLNLKLTQNNINLTTTQIEECKSKTALKFNPSCGECSTNCKFLVKNLSNLVLENKSHEEMLEKYNQQKSQLESTAQQQTQFLQQLNTSLQKAKELESLKTGLDRINELLFAHKAIAENKILAAQKQELQQQIQSKETMLNNLNKLSELKKIQQELEHAEQSSKIMLTVVELESKLNYLLSIKSARDKHELFAAYNAEQQNYIKTQQETNLKQTISACGAKLETIENFIQKETNAIKQPPQLTLEEYIKSFELRRIQIEEEISSTTTLNNELRENLGKHKSILSQYKPKLSEITQYETDSPQILAIIKVYETYERLIGKTGLETEIIKNNIGEIQTKMNDILSQLTDFKIEFKLKNAKTDSLESKLKIYLVEGAKSVSIDMASGYQRFVINLVFRLVLTSILPFSCDFILIDEGFGSADKENLEKINEFLTEICKLYKFVFIISHLDNVQRVVEQPILINQTANGNNICFDLPENYQFTKVECCDFVASGTAINTASKITPTNNQEQIFDTPRPLPNLQKAEIAEYDPQITCVCGAKIKKSNKTHAKSKKHMDFVNKKN